MVLVPVVAVAEKEVRAALAVAEVREPEARLVFLCGTMASMASCAIVRCNQDWPDSEVLAELVGMAEMEARVAKVELCSLPAISEREEVAVEVETVGQAGKVAQAQME
jgi:hypothetical protein